MSEECIEGHAKLNEALDDILSTLDKSSFRRKRIFYRLAKRAMQLNCKRIAAQQTPEGITFVPRKPKSREGKKGPMFKRLRNSRWFVIESDDEGGCVRFRGTAAHIATVHHFGLRDRIDRKSSLRIKYQSRPLLGITDDDAEILENDIRQYIEHVIKKHK